MKVSAPMAAGLSIAGIGIAFAVFRLIRGRGDTDCDIDFADPTAHRFQVLLNFVNPQIKQIEAMYQRLAEARAQCDSVDDFQRQNGRKLMEIDEKITKLMINIDGVELGDSADLKAQRKEYIERINELATRISALVEK